MGEVVRETMWPTPVTTDAKSSRRATAKTEEWESHEGVTLLDAVMMWPTPTATPYGTRNNGNPHDHRSEYATKGAPSLETIAAKEGGHLNPEWVEALMGFPIGWSDGPHDPETLPLFGNHRK